VDARLLIHAQRGEHRLKLGLSGGVASHSQDWGQTTGGAALVGQGEPWGSWTGVVDARTFARDVSPTVPRFSVLVEDRWTPDSGVTVDAGVRFDSEWLPLTDEAAGPLWFQQAGLTVTTLQEQVSTGSGFLGLTWNAGAGTTFGLRGAYTTDEVDPLLLGEILASTEFLATRLQSTFPGWPRPIDRGTFPSGTKPGYTYLAQDPKRAETMRFSGGLGQTLAPGTMLDAGVVFRRTEGLVRRRDLNRPAAPRGTDAGGRALWGEPTQVGSWLGGDPNTLGRFAMFGPVWELDQGGWSEYLGVTLRVRSGAAPGLHWSAEYTWSRTEDNMPGLGTVGRLAGVPLDGVEGEEVTSGVSDLDRPHRAVFTLGIPVPVGEASHLSGVYRFQSGAPFTPGYAPGVDANMDGVLGNDPAFVSSDALAAHESEWGCLRSDSGGFATRNGCRGPDAHTLDLRLLLDIPAIGGALFVDAFNVLDRELSLLDTALLGVDSSGGITRQGSTVGLPLETNPEFGSPVRDLSTGRMLRVGVRIGR
jgi:hypothetical protein